MTIQNYFSYKNYIFIFRNFFPHEINNLSLVLSKNQFILFFKDGT